MACIWMDGFMDCAQVCALVMWKRCKYCTLWIHILVIINVWLCTRPAHVIIQIMNGYECNGTNISWVERWNVPFNEAQPSWMEHVQSFNEWNICTIARIKTIHYLFYTTPLITDIAMKSLDKSLHIVMHPSNFHPPLIENCVIEPVSKYAHSSKNRNARV